MSPPRHHVPLGAFSRAAVAAFLAVFLAVFLVGLAAAAAAGGPELEGFPPQTVAGRGPSHLLADQELQPLRRAILQQEQPELGEFPSPTMAGHGPSHLLADQELQPLRRAILQQEQPQEQPQEPQQQQEQPEAPSSACKDALEVAMATCPAAAAAAPVGRGKLLEKLKKFKRKPFQAPLGVQLQPQPHHHAASHEVEAQMQEQQQEQPQEEQKEQLQEQVQEEFQRRRLSGDKSDDTLLLYTNAQLEGVQQDSSRTSPKPINEGWTPGRMTFYGQNDGYHIEKGSCQYGDVKWPYYVAAIQDANNPWFDDRCGRCFEIACIPEGPTRGVRGFSRYPDGETACKGDASTSVVVVMTDSCPCHHDNPSNQDWCCGDVMHFDVSWAAFDAIALREKGVVDIAFRRVDCNDAMRTFEGVNVDEWLVQSMGRVE